MRQDARCRRAQGFPRIESKSLGGRSKAEYLRQVRKLAEHYAGRELGAITQREVFDYLVHRREVEKLRPSTLNQAVVALRMLYHDYLGRQWALWERFQIRRDQPLPVVPMCGDQAVAWQREERAFSRKLYPAALRD